MVYIQYRLEIKVEAKCAEQEQRESLVDDAFYPDDSVGPIADKNQCSEVSARAQVIHKGNQSETWSSWTNQGPIVSHTAVVHANTAIHSHPV